MINEKISKFLYYIQEMLQNFTIIKNRNYLIISIFYII